MLEYVGLHVETRDSWADTGVCPYGEGIEDTNRNCPYEDRKWVRSSIGILFELESFGVVFLVIIAEHAEKRGDFLNGVSRVRGDLLVLKT